MNHVEPVDPPPELAEIVAEFGQADDQMRLELLLEFSAELPDLPDRYAQHPELLEPVPECQSPIFVTTELSEDGGTGGDERLVRLFFQAPAEAPTTRGFAGILHAGLDGVSVATVRTVPADLPLRLSLESTVTPLRLHGMSGMLARIKRQVEVLAADSD